MAIAGDAAPDLGRDLKWLWNSPGSHLTDLSLLSPPLPQIIANEHLNRRNRFIMACSLGVGIGVTIYPQWANTALWPCTDCSSGVKSLRDAIILILSSGLT
jgi:hypothetical protein